MLDYNAWSANESPILEAARARDAWRRIQRRPTSIVIERGRTTTLPAQTVRIELSSTSSGTPQIADQAGSSGKLNSIIFGVKGHADASVQDTDIQRDDRFAVGEQWFHVIDVIVQVGEIQAICEVQS